MALRRNEFARTAQPQGEVGLDPDHWLTPWVRQGVLAGPVRNATVEGRYTTATALQNGVTSQPGVAIEFTGSGGYIASPSVATSAAWTLLSYGVPRSLASTSAIATMAEAPGNSTRDRSLYIVASTGTVGAYVYDGADKSVATSNAVEADKPALVAAVSTGTTIGAYCKGALTTAATSNSGYAAYASPELVHGYGGGVLGAGATNASTWSAYYTLLIRRALTLAELRELEENPWAILAPEVVEWMLATGGGAQTATIGQVTETDTAQPFTAVAGSVAAIGQASESDTAQALASTQTRTISQAAETDTAQPLASAQAKGIGQASETDSAQPLSTAQAATIGQAQETDAAQALTYSAPGSLGQTQETDQALPLQASLTLTIGQVTETDTAQPMGASSSATIGMALEIDTAGAFAVQQARAIGQATETDAAQAFTVGTPGSGTGATAAEIWSYVLSNGKTAEENLVENNTMLTDMSSLLADCPANLLMVLRLLRNKQITNPTTGVFTVFADDDVTPLLQGNLFEDAAGAQPYRGQGAERREKLS